MTGIISKKLCYNVQNRKKALCGVSFFIAGKEVNVMANTPKTEYCYHEVTIKLKYIVKDWNYHWEVDSAIEQALTSKGVVDGNGLTFWEAKTKAIPASRFPDDENSGD